MSGKIKKNLQKYTFLEHQEILLSILDFLKLFYQNLKSFLLWKKEDYNKSMLKVMKLWKWNANVSENFHPVHQLLHLPQPILKVPL